MPTEVQVEKRYGIRKNDLPPEKFRELCIKLTEENIKHMREDMQSLGFSIDWTTEYRTMDPSYYSKTQLSFVRLYNRGLIYRGEHPVNWCPRCETAIADAEVEYGNREAALSYIKFNLHEKDEHIIIATTRPEYLHACVVVAVHPNDERYNKFVGEKLEVPLFGQVVGIIEDQEVNPEFGTGAVMICTYGDKTDVRWIKRHKLPVIKAIDERGKLSESAGEYAGMSIDDAKRAIIENLKKVGLLVKQEKLTQNVGVCWRCKTPVEILTKPQWFMRTLDLNHRVIEEAKKIRWVPEYMGQRLIDWAESMDWDWVISRQRIFATPIPAWYCTRCKEPIVAEEKQLPVHPARDKQPVERCPKCNHDGFEPERDVLDTWMDSSITIAAHARWPELDGRLFPADLQPNGTDIIRTWDYYLLVRHLALLNEAPYRTVLINGMVLGTDGKAMHKSLGNYVDSTTVREKYGADALRQWAAIGASTGSDIPFSWKDVEFGYRFIRKFWNAARFAGLHLKNLKISDVTLEELELKPTDRWILSRLNRLIKEVTSYLEDFQFNRALTTIQTFIWHEFCDMYVEEIKYRLYGNNPTAKAASYVLHQVIINIAKLLAPFTPHFADEIYHTYFSQDYPFSSIHVTTWPEANEQFIDENAEKLGEILNLVVSAIRQFKSDQGMPLNKELQAVEIYTPDEKVARELSLINDDISGTMHVKRLDIILGKPELTERVLKIEPNMARLGSRLRTDVKVAVQAIRESDPKKLSEQLEQGSITLSIGNKKFELTREEVKIFKETSSKGCAVEVINIPEPALTLIITQL